MWMARLRVREEGDSQILYVEGENESLSLKGISVGADSGVDV
jgi:hypothetical protein